MRIKQTWVVLDTNVWIFGLRNHPERPACAQVLRQLHRLQVKIPRQILKELQSNLTEEELHDLFCLLKRYPERIEFQWHKVNPKLIRKYQGFGCKLGDATVAAHVEAMHVNILVSENRDFLEEISNLPFQVLRAEELLQVIGER